MKSASQNTHTHTHARTQTITRARVLIPRKGACVAGRDSNPLRLHQWRSRDAETRTGKEVTLDQPGRGFFVVVSHHPAVYPFDIFSGPAIYFFLPSRWPDFTCDSAERKGARAWRESRTDQRGGDRLVRGRGERVSGQRLCVFGLWGSPDRAGRRPLVSPGA